MFQKFNDIENFYNKILNEKMEHQIAYIVIYLEHLTLSFTFLIYYSCNSEEKESGQLIGKLAVFYHKMRPKPNLAATFQSFLVRNCVQFKIPKITVKYINQIVLETRGKCKFI
jgi:hypothetical protein